MCQLKESKESLKAIDNFLYELTEVELETESKTLFTLCEAVREIELYKIEGPILDSFIEWARIESRKHQKRIDDLVRTTDAKAIIDPNQGELIPVSGVDMSFSHDCGVEVEIEGDKITNIRKI
jgi:hypothetical protein